LGKPQKPPPNPKKKKQEPPKLLGGVGRGKKVHVFNARGGQSDGSVAFSSEKKLLLWRKENRHPD